MLIDSHKHHGGADNVLLVYMYNIYGMLLAIFVFMGVVYRRICYKCFLIHRFITVMHECNKLGPPECFHGTPTNTTKECCLYPSIHVNVVNNIFVHGCGRRMCVSYNNNLNTLMGLLQTPRRSRQCVMYIITRMVIILSYIIFVHIGVVEECVLQKFSSFITS